MTTYDEYLEAAAIVGEKELYEFYFASATEPERFTSSWQDITIPATGHAWSNGSAYTFYSAAIVRDSLKTKHGLVPDSTKLVIPVESPKFQQALVNGESGPIVVKIIRGFGDPVGSQESFVRYWFSGTITEIQIKGSIVGLVAKSMEYMLNLVTIPKARIMRLCNWYLFQPQPTGEAGMKMGGCGLAEATFTYAFTVEEVASDGSWLRVTPDDPGSSEFDSPDDEGDPDSGTEPTLGHYTLGRVFAEGEPTSRSAMVIKQEHTPGNPYCYLYLHIPVPGITATPPNNRVEASWGCDGRNQTCIDKFNNRLNGGMWHRIPPYEPAKVPVFKN